MPVMETEQGSLVYPDPLTHPCMLSGAAFLYFPSPLLLPFPPCFQEPSHHQVLIELLHRARTDCGLWSRRLTWLVICWALQMMAYLKMSDALAPLAEAGVCSFGRIRYPVSTRFMQEVVSTFGAAGLPLARVVKIMNPVTAASQTIHYIVDGVLPEVGGDVEALIHFCRSQLSNRDQLGQLLAKAYLVRLMAGPRIQTRHVLLTYRGSLRLMRLARSMKREARRCAANDVLAWELFREILAPYVDPLSRRNVELLVRLHSRCRGEIDRLRDKCWIMASQLKPTPNPEEVASQIQRLIRTQAKAEIKDILRLDSRAWNGFLTKTFADQRTWLSIGSLALALLTDPTWVFTSATLIWTLSLVAPRAAQSLMTRREELSSSDWALVYRAARLSSRHPLRRRPSSLPEKTRKPIACMAEVLDRLSDWG